MGTLQTVGRAIGGLLAPLAAEVSLVRGARLFHADGTVRRAVVEPLATDGPLGDLAQALKGPALVRLSNAMRRYHRGEDPPDIFGAAVRFHPGEGARPAEDSQDLLFATFAHVWQLPLGALLTHRHDYLDNEYFAVLPFRIPGAQTRFAFRLVPEHRDVTGDAPVDRVERLDRDIAAGGAALRLDARVKALGTTFVPVARITLGEHVPMGDPEDEAIRFDPFRDGAGIVPVGLVQAVRTAVYPASQAGRAAAHGPEDRAEGGG